MAGRLAGKTALVFGAGSAGPGWGNGKAAATLFAREGASVFCVDINQAAAQETANIICGEGGKAEAVQADASKASDVVRKVGSCLDRFGRIDVLDNNVGIAEVGGVVEVSEEAWDRVFAVNLKSCFLGMKHVIPVMERQGGGSIINISSIASIRYTGVPYTTYYASKAAMNHLTHTAAVEYAPKKIRVVSSAGETLNPEVIKWFETHLDCAINDHYGQTEIGMVVCNHHGLRHPINLGSAGLPVPGFAVAVVDDEGREVPRGTPGILAVDRNRSPLFWFQGYWQQETTCWVGDYHLTGDTVRQNADGSISFVGRADDIIISSAYRIGPYEVESVLIEHPAVVEAAVVGKPDPERTELVKAFVVPRSGYEPAPELAEGLQQFVKTRL